MLPANGNECFFSAVTDFSSPPRWLVSSKKPKFFYIKCFILHISHIKIWLWTRRVSVFVCNISSLPSLAAYCYLKYLCLENTFFNPDELLLSSVCSFCMLQLDSTGESCKQFQQQLKKTYFNGQGRSNCFLTTLFPDKSSVQCIGTQPEAR